MTFHTHCLVGELSQVGEARRVSNYLCSLAGLDVTLIGQAAIIVTELATNLVKYATDGQLLMRADLVHGFEVFALDRGPGMNVAVCLQDGYSTGGTPGNGLGAVRRLSTEFDMYSDTARGTVMFARLCPKASTFRREPPIQWSAINLPMIGEEVCGDAWSLKIQADSLSIMVSDGLGHGKDACAASQIAVGIFEGEDNILPKPFIEKANRAMAGSRGGAVACGRLHLETNQFQYAGVGNISGNIFSTSESRGLMSHNGTVGGTMRTVQQIGYDWPSGWTLVMHSDGLMTRWNLADYPGVKSRHPAIIAGVLLRDFNRGRDDITVVVIKRL